ncbi:glutamate--cysteine ligase [Corynebacterium sp. 320]|uniref:glutamate--cysteine ligase n=1 Tax=Corynebacterium TaxID=1716 RepID=UPI00125CC423|nr:MULTISPECIES: glutamate--cysteine ligase [Corynebacterium]KAB1503224.1 glutamate--cysteine ligase [Corynebacterium sp. 320]KAB1550818.1 glutamate--cysteine ligase [Corynebacterium sp. 321]KAB1551175.1 glutamate--cysteine ligase [Corynebacterium sp. 319]KAB3527021.1 glutamate--cysteine ligase [Corynebacterium sp. 250]KAB3538515.1 glutamate--cysteine ligase [Corynebacterium sp. 366]
MDFPGSEPTVGIEWEVALVDPKTRDLVPRAAELLEKMDSDYLGHRVVREFLANTVEMVTGVHRTVPEAVDDLRQQLLQLLDAADQCGVHLFSAGTHPFAHWGDQVLSEKSSYQEIIERTQYWGRQMLIWGIHVHVGVGSKEKVWPIINAVMTHYPHVLALSASSPAWEGLDTGYASNRTLLYQQLPTAGIPYQFASWEEWEQFNVDQDRSGVINHTGSMHFDVRPSKYGTVEIRFADATMEIWELAAIAAYIHCLVVFFERQYDEGEELPLLQPWHVAENKWRAARYGLEALIITDRETTERWVTDELKDWVTTLMPVAEELGCAAELADVLRLVDRGGDYTLQRNEARAAGAALEPSVRTRGDAGAEEGFTQPKAWVAAVDLTVESLRRSVGR